MTHRAGGLGIARRERLAERPFQLSLSAGFFGFFAHTGFLMALEEAGLVPSRVVGVSAGSLAGGLWAAGLSASMISERLLALKRRDFWDPGLPLGGLLAGRRFEKLLQEALDPTGVTRVERTPIPFAAIAYDLFARRVAPLQSGSLPRAIRASCCAPVLFRPVRWGWRLLIDGGVADRCGHAVLDEGAPVVAHYLPSGSSWSGLYDEATVRLPRGDVLIAKGLPRVTPFRLRHGPVALEHSYAAARRWLDEA